MPIRAAAPLRARPLPGRFPRLRRPAKSTAWIRAALVKGDHPQLQRLHGIDSGCRNPRHRHRRRNPRSRRHQTSADAGHQSFHWCQHHRHPDHWRIGGLDRGPRDHTVRQPGHHGCADRGNTKLFIRNTIVSHNGKTGIELVATGPNNVEIENTSTINNLFGVATGTGNNVMARRSALSGNATAGVEAVPGGAVNVDDSAISGNGTAASAGRHDPAVELGSFLQQHRIERNGHDLRKQQAVRKRDAWRHFVSRRWRHPPIWVNSNRGAPNSRSAYAAGT
jgi:hypothetical protein